MRNSVLVIFAMLAITSVGCGDGGGGGGGSLSSRCDRWCDRRNADPECDPGADINCAATCPAFALNATNTGCEAQAQALLTCFQNTADLCVTGQPAACNTENTLLVQCESGDGGP